MSIRLNKLLAERGLASRRGAEQLIADGEVVINGQTILHPGTMVDPETDHIRVSGQRLPRRAPPVYLMMNKPKGVITSASDPHGRTTTAELLPELRWRVEPVGRLDFNTEGILLLTNDGSLAHQLTHPRFHVSKTYVVKVTGVPEERKLRYLESGVNLEDGRTAPAVVRVMLAREANSWLRVTVREGRNRLLRRMFEEVGHQVLKLKRIAFADVLLGDLPPGQTRVLSDVELEELRKLAEQLPGRAKNLDLKAPPVESRAVVRAAFESIGVMPPADELKEARPGRPGQERPKRMKRGKGWAKPAPRKKRRPTGTRGGARTGGPRRGGGRSGGGRSGGGRSGGGRSGGRGSSR